MEHGGRVVSVDTPMPTITTARGGAFGVAEPFLVPFYGENGKQTPRTHDVNAPLPVIPATAAKFGLVEPFVVEACHGEGDNTRRSHSLDKPLGTLPCTNRFALVEPFVVELSGTGADNLPRSARSVDEPLGTVRAGGTHHAVVEPFLLGQHGGAVARPVTEPAPTVTTDGAISLIEPYLTQYYGSGSGLIARSVRVPLPPVTTKERFALVEPLVIDGKTLDIRFRMLKPHELSAAMGFPADYAFTGTKTEHVKQIGNAVSVRTARALCVAALGLAAQPSRRKEIA
jgi:DNA (cytosine-5)-methyltransferase 1